MSGRDLEKFVVDDVQELDGGRPFDGLSGQLWPECDVPLVRLRLKLHGGDETGDFHYEMPDEEIRLVVVEGNPVWPVEFPALASEPDVRGQVPGDGRPPAEEDRA